MSWRFDRILVDDPERAAALEAVGGPEEFLASLAGALETALTCGEVRFGREHADDQRGGHRAVIQFAVTPLLFDWFFNGRTGYRAHFRASPSCGLSFNDRIIQVVLDVLHRTITQRVVGREIVGKFEDGGPASLPREYFARSLAPTLSKIWWCTRRIGRNGGIEGLATGLIGPRLEIAGATSWAAPYRDVDGAWLDAYGAFLGHAGLYQPKDPVHRANRIHDSGDA